MGSGLDFFIGLTQDYCNYKANKVFKSLLTSRCLVTNFIWLTLKY
jgi:hypothetical protein